MDLSQAQRKYACTLCARRKIKCDKLQPCHNCSRSQAECHYETPAPSQRPRKRGADSEALSRIREYEELLRKNNIEFSAYEKGSSSIPWNKTGGKSPSEGNTFGIVSSTRSEHVDYGERSLWTSLDPELQNPTLRNRPPSLRMGESDVEGLNAPLSFLSNSTNPILLDFHPEPQHIFKLWQIFVEKTNPLTKIVHVPTLQQRIVEISWNLQSIPKSTEALLFAIYILAVVSISSSDCQTQFGADKATLLKRYKRGAIRSLMAADLFCSRDLEVLQAFVLFLLAAPDSETSTTLMSVAIRLAYKMGLHNERPSHKVSFFEKEMRTRLWWQIRCNSGRGLREYIPSAQDPRTVRLPLNLNDSDLHPDMASSPIEHVGATEMTYCLLKYEGALWRQSHLSQNAHIKKRPDPDAPISYPQILKDGAIQDLERLFEEKYLRFCDPSIPVHFLSLTFSRLVICHLRFRAGHPQGRVDGGAGITPEKRDQLFELSVRLLELQRDSQKTSFAPQLLSHMERSQLDTLIYMLYELRGRPTGDRVDAAWDLVELFYEQHREWMKETKNSLLDALIDLTLEAWQVRWKGLLETGGGRGVDDITPWYIKELRTKRPQESEPVDTGDLGFQGGGEMDSATPFPEIPMNFGDEYMYSAEYWNEFLQM